MFDSVRYFDDDFGWTMFAACAACGQDVLRFAGTQGHSPVMALGQDGQARERSREEVEQAACIDLERAGWTMASGQPRCPVCSLTNTEPHV